MTTKQEFSGSLEHAEVMFDALVGLEGRYSVCAIGADATLCVRVMLPAHRRSAFTNGQTFYGVGIKDPYDRMWYWTEELIVHGPRTWSDTYGAYLDYTFFSRGRVWRGENPEMMEALAS